MAVYKYIKAKPISYGGKRDKKDVKYIVIHYTGNNGDTAKNNVDYFHNGNTREAGAHFFVDQNGKVYKSIAMNLIAWSVGGYVTQANGAGSYYGKCLNANSVSIELCDCATKDPSDAMIKATKKLVKYIRKYCPNANTIIRHYDVSGKQCPARMASMSGEKYARWIKFRNAIDGNNKAKKATSKSYPTVTLRYGDKGSQVKKLQRCLNKLIDAELDVDGQFGGQTLKAVLKFQKRYKLEIDGICGPLTRKKIKSLLK